jgi:Na+-translocating ferredoxin:NAD+ oxidoreductase RnfG subunit
MKINFIIILCIFQIGNASIILDKCKENIQTIFSKDDSLEQIIWSIPTKIKKEIEIQTKQRFFRNNLHIWKIYKNNSIIGTAILDNVLGKSMPISFLVIFNLNGQILNTKIIKYREPYGGEISSLNWLNQFTNRTDSSSFKIGKEIDGISGATISVNSVSIGIHKLALLYPILNLIHKRE